MFHIYIITENNLIEMLVFSMDVKWWRPTLILICLCLMFSYQPLGRSDSVLVSKLQLLCHSQVPFHSASWLWLLHPTFCRVGLLAKEIFNSSPDSHPWKSQQDSFGDLPFCRSWPERCDLMSGFSSLGYFSRSSFIPSAMHRSKSLTKACYGISTFSAVLVSKGKQF